MFRKSGRPKEKKPIFEYFNEEIEIVKNYTYLGIPFSSSMTGTNAIQNAIDESRVAMRAVIPIMNKKLTIQQESLSFLRR